MLTNTFVKYADFNQFLLNSLKIEIAYKYVEDERETPRDTNYVIVLQPTGEVEVDLTALASYCQSGNGTSTDPPLRPIQALDIALKHGAAQRLVSILVV